MRRYAKLGSMKLTDYLDFSATLVPCSISDKDYIVRVL